MPLRFSAIFVCLTAFALSAQTPGFDAASIKPSPPNSHGGRLIGSGGRFEVSFFTVKQLIQWAWNLPEFEVLDGPGWLQSTDRSASERFDVRATAAASSTQPGLRLMLQRLLADRFHLQSHRETRTIPAYALVLAKNGPKLQPTAEADPQGMRMMPEGVVSHGGSMARLAEMLTNDRPVVDKTGLTGLYDFTLKWRDDDPQSPSLFTALQEQIGLRLESTKTPVEVLIIDSCLKQPIEN